MIFPQIQPLKVCMVFPMYTPGTIKRNFVCKICESKFRCDLMHGMIWISYMKWLEDSDNLIFVRLIEYSENYLSNDLHPHLGIPGIVAPQVSHCLAFILFVAYWVCVVRWWRQNKIPIRLLESAVCAFAIGMYKCQYFS